MATLLLTGAFGAPDLDPAALRDKDRWALADKVTVEHDMDLSLRMAHATSPWARRCGRPASGPWSGRS